MLHRHGETESYRKIFCHIIKLVFHLVIKSASTKKNNLQKQFTMPFGIEYNFFAQNTTMTTWRYHKDKEGRGIKEREYIHSCLLHICLWRDNYRRRSPFVRFQIEDLTRHLFTEFRIENRLKPLLEKRVNAPLQTSIIIKETMNNHPEKSLNWKPYKITNLIK